MFTWLSAWRDRRRERARLECEKQEILRLLKPSDINAWRNWEREEEAARRAAALESHDLFDIAEQAAKIQNASNSLHVQIVVWLGSLDTSGSVPLLLRFLDYPATSVWWAAARALRKRGCSAADPRQADKLAAADLAEGLQRDDREGQYRSIIALAESRNELAYELLLWWLRATANGSERLVDAFTVLNERAGASAIAALIYFVKNLRGREGEHYGGLVIPALRSVLARHASAARDDDLRQAASLKDVKDTYGIEDTESADGCYRGKRLLQSDVDCSQVHAFARRELARRKAPG